MKKVSVVLDTNVFVAAGFQPSSSSGRIIEAVREGRLRIVWTESTRQENERVLGIIPPLEWDSFDVLFAEDARFEGELDMESVSYIPDASDRKFAALAEASGATLVSNDHHLLDQRIRGKTPILTPSEFWNLFKDELT